jgi:glycosidase
MDDFIFGTLATPELRLQHTLEILSAVTHRQNRAPLDPLPGESVTIRLSAGPEQPASRAWVYFTTDGSDPAGERGTPQNGYALEMTPAASEWNTALWGYLRHFHAEIPPQPAGTLVRYRLSSADKTREVWADGGAYYAFFVENDPAPDWTRDAILYQIFADRFFAESPLFPQTEAAPSHKSNGTLRGILQKLDYIQSLGANCLWLTPVFPSPSYHGYDATDFYEINPRLGSKEDFKELLNAVHARGMRLLMDFVPNHWSNRHPHFVEAQTEPQSPARQWYTFEEWPHKYKTFFGVKTLPQINLRHAPARQHVLDAARYWLDFGVDGFRVDYSIGPSPDFYAAFRQTTRLANPQSWTFGEAVDPPDSQITFAGGMDGSLDFMLLEALRQAFAFGKWKAAQLAAFLDRHEAYFPAGFSRPSFLDNHDMNRFLWAAGNDKRKLRLAALCQFTLPGAPIIYYGTEVGLSQQRDIRQNGRALHEEARLPMIWGAAQDADLLAYYQNLCRIRTEHPNLARTPRKTLLADGNLLVYQSAELITALNLGDSPAQLPSPLRRLLLQTDPACALEGDKLLLSPFGGVTGL